LPGLTLTTSSGERIRQASRKRDRIEYILPATGEYALRW
jgi:hypothetical protein